MEIKRKSAYKKPTQDRKWLKDWIKQLQQLNNRQYLQRQIESKLGTTYVYNIRDYDPNLETLVIFPGFRTSVLFWDFDRALDAFGKRLNLFLVETNGQPNLSDGNTPDIRGLDYGHWAADIIQQLGLQRCYIAGASFGGLVCMKLSSTNPELIKSSFLLNPGGLKFISLQPHVLYKTLLPVFFPSPKNIQYFLDTIVFSKPNHAVKHESENLLVDYERFAMTRFKDKTQKPYDMKDELREVKADTYLLLGDQDYLFPYKRSKAVAEEKISNLQEVKVFENVGHGIETYVPALTYVREKIEQLSAKNQE